MVFRRRGALHRQLHRDRLRLHLGRPARSASPDRCPPTCRSSSSSGPTSSCGRCCCAARLVRLAGADQRQPARHLGQGACAIRPRRQRGDRAGAVRARDDARQRPLPARSWRNAPGARPARPAFYAPTTESVLDLVLARQIETRETAYSRPLAYKAFIKEPMVTRRPGGARLSPALEVRRRAPAEPRCAVGRRHRGEACRRASPAGWPWRRWRVLLAAFLMRALARRHCGAALRDIAADRTHIPVRAGLATLRRRSACIAGPMIALAGSYHVLGTDRTGNDVLYQSLKSVRTAFVIGTLATMAHPAVRGRPRRPRRLPQGLGRRGDPVRLHDR